MDQIRITGGNQLHGNIPISGAKNAALPLMAVCLLSKETLSLSNIPYLADVSSMVTLLASMGVKVEMDDGLSVGKAKLQTLNLCAQDISNPLAEYELVRKMRASVLVLGPLLSRFGRAVVSLPGGCAIGTRPVDLHIQAMQSLGANIELNNGYIHASAPDGLSGAEIVFPLVSVGATENAMMAACLARGQTIIRNAAQEPEIIDLGDCLNAMGAKISGLGTSNLVIDGVSSLHQAAHIICPDRIEAGTYAVAAAICGGDVTLTNVRPAALGSLLDKLRQAGVAVTTGTDTIRITRDPKNPLRPLDIVTEPFPGFPTDLQAQMMTLLTLAEGESKITETIFENRFMHAPELMRMGAKIDVHGAVAVVHGAKELIGAPVMATDLRASVSLVLAGLAARGQTTVNRIYHLDRGYERLEEKLAACGAQIERVAA
jgi:UDP-N-acetylglucosamine 1-carboxyvinyltransferase